MRNLKKLTAILLVSAMCIGTAFTSFAAEGDGPSQDKNEGTENVTPTPTPTPEQVEVNGGFDYLGGYASDKDGNPVPAYADEITDEKVIETLKNEDELKEILGQKFVVGSKDEVKVIAASELGIYGEMPEGGVDFEFYVNDNDVKAGDTVYVLHKKADGTWEVFAAVVNKDGTVTVRLTSLSPVAIVKVMSDGSVKVLKEKATATSAKKSPKTGA